MNMVLSKGHRAPRPCGVGLASTILVGLALLPARNQVAAADAMPRFEHDVLPILQAHCLKCHGAKKREGGLDLRTVGGILKGGDDGPVLVKGAAARSALLAKVAAGEMPLGKAK